MKYKTILWLNFAGLVEAFLLSFLIQRGLIVCKIEGDQHSILNIIALVTAKNMLVIGGYQLYFWPQHNHHAHKKVYLKPTAFDKWIPAVPALFWVYSPLYYVFFSLAVLCLKNYNSTAFNAWIMLLHASFWFTYFPTGVSKEFREQIRKVPTNKLTRFIMDLVHSYDTEDNACPSMHCAFAIFLAFITYPFYPVLSVAFPIIVSISCLLTKQHLIVDIFPGLLLGTIHGLCNVWLL
jgi:hypothetical protein